MTNASASTRSRPVVRARHRVPAAACARLALAAALAATACAGCGRERAIDAPPGATYALRGTLAPLPDVAGARVHLGGHVARVTTADAAGGYAFEGLPDGDYTVTPSQAGLEFGPVLRSVTVRGADVDGVDFTAEPFAGNFTVDGTRTFQAIGGMGVNVNVEAWKGGQLRPALDLLCGAPGSGNGATLFRVIRDPMTWVADEADIAPLHARDAATLARIYETAPMRDLWSVIAHLNSRGIRGGKIMLNFMGWTPVWLGGGGAYGADSRITAGKEAAFATMVASLVYYGRTVRGLDFTLLAPMNEQDWNCLEGPCAGPAQYVTVLAALIAELDAMGLSDVRLVGPDTAGQSQADSYIEAMMADAVVAARTDHLAIHNYGGAAGARTAYPGHDYWVTEIAGSCSNCDDAGTPAQGEWAFAAQSGEAVLGSLDQGAAAVCVYDGYDSFYFHHDSFGYWGLLAYDPGSGAYTKRKRFHVSAQINGFVRPGTVRLAVDDATGDLGTVVAFRDPATGKVAIVGRNPGAAVTLRGRIDPPPPFGTLSRYTTDDGAANLQRGPDVPLAAGEFVVTIPADCFFSLAN